MFKGFVLLFFAVWGIFPAFAAMPPNLAVNGFFDQAVTGTSQAVGWSSVSGYNSYTRVVESGNAMIKLVGSTDKFTAAKQVRVLNQSVAKPVRVTALIKCVNVADKSSDNFGACLYVIMYPKGGGSPIYSSNTLKTKSVGSFNTWRWIGMNTAQRTNLPLEKIEVFLFLGKVTGTVYFDNATIQEFGPTTGCVTLMFDDGEASTYTEALPILSARGYRGSAAPVTGYVGLSSYYMSWTQIRALKQAGWDIVSHSKTHPHLSGLSLSALQDQVYGSKDIFASNGVPVDDYIAPYGEYSQLLNGQCQLAGYLSMRGVERGDNPPGVFPYSIWVQECNSDVPLSQIIQWMNDARANGHWLILLFHSVSNNHPSDKYFVTPDMLRSIVAKVEKSGLQVRTYSEALGIFGYGHVKTAVTGSWQSYR